MWNRLRSNDAALSAIFLAAALSFAVWPLALSLGLHGAPAGAPDAYQTYFEQTNWWPYPFFFLALAPVLWLTWRPMLDAWRQLAETGVLQGYDGSRPEEAALQPVLRAIAGKRRGAIVFALVTALAVNLADWMSAAPFVFGLVSFDRQVGFACAYPSPFVHWIFAAAAADVVQPCAAAEAFYTAWAARDGLPPPPGQLLFIVALLLQQFLIVFFAALGFAQIMLHTFLFAIFERLDAARDQGFCLVLNARSPLNEFGLEHWNFALNNFYWAASPALLGVFLSRAATPPEEYLPGQVLLGFAVPLALIAPMVATIIVRQLRLPAVWTLVYAGDTLSPEDYRRQQLWPLDRNWSSKLGILLAFALAALAIGFELTKLMRL